MMVGVQYPLDVVDSGLVEVIHDRPRAGIDDQTVFTVGDQIDTASVRELIKVI